METRINVLKIIGKAPENQFQAMDQANKAQQEVLDACHIMESILQFPDDMEFHKKRMEKYLSQFK